MPTAIPCDAERSRRAWTILAGYNLPFLLWSAYAVWRVFRPGTALGCPVHALLGWCPSCGLTGDYAAVLAGRAPDHALIWMILGGFSANALWSLAKAWRIVRARGEPAPQPR